MQETLGLMPRTIIRCDICNKQLEEGIARENQSTVNLHKFWSTKVLDLCSKHSKDFEDWILKKKGDE